METLSDRAGQPNKPSDSNLISISDLMNALFKSVDDGIIVGDLNGKIIFANDAAVRINDNNDFPTDPEERVLHFFSENEKSQPSLKSDLPLRRALTEGEVRGHEVELLTPKGHLKRLLCNGRALYNDSGERIGSVLVLHDQTKERAAEKTKLNLEKERIELLRMNAELERFASIAAHDLKSPLNSITQFVELLRENLGDKIGKDEEEILKYITNAGARLRSLIDDLLTYAKTGKDLGEKASLDLDIVMTEVLSSLQSDLKAANAVIDVGPLPVLYADRVGIIQVFQNLIANAIKYKGENSPVVQIRAYEQQDCWRFTVKDNGVGIRREDQAAVFELFKRVDGCQLSEGTGLGLPICKRVVTAHGGSLWLESQRGHGTTMIFTLQKPKKLG